MPVRTRSQSQPPTPATQSPTQTNNITHPSSPPLTSTTAPTQPPTPPQNNNPPPLSQPPTSPTFTRNFTAPIPLILDFVTLQTSLQPSQPPTLPHISQPLTTIHSGQPPTAESQPLLK
jgi:hypothetical protein